MSKNRMPQAAAAPQPPSLVALPPRHMMIFLAPRPAAWRSNSPTPKVVVRSGFFGSARGRPAAAAISTTAVPSGKRPYSARMCCPLGPVQTVATRSPPQAVRNASTLPSPPSATGRETISVSGKISRIALVSSPQTSREVIVPLKESGAKMIFFMARPPKTVSKADALCLTLYHMPAVLSKKIYARTMRRIRALRKLKASPLRRAGDVDFALWAAYTLKNIVCRTNAPGWAAKFCGQGAWALFGSFQEE